jgi:hypothetical protein
MSMITELEERKGKKWDLNGVRHGRLLIINILIFNDF